MTLEQVTDIAGYGRFSRDVLGEPLGTFLVRVDDGDDAATGALNRVRVPPPHQPRTDDGGANGRRGG